MAAGHRNCNAQPRGSPLMMKTVQKVGSNPPNPRQITLWVSGLLTLQILGMNFGARYFISMPYCIVHVYPLVYCSLLVSNVPSLLHYRLIPRLLGLTLV